MTDQDRARSNPVGGPYKVVMPEDGWDNREVTFNCDLCDRTLTATSVYLNMDALLQMDMTQADFFLEIHRNDKHTWHADTRTWTA